jgi:hypothetical protein
MESTEAEFDMNCPVSDRGRFGVILAVEASVVVVWGSGLPLLEFWTLSPINPACGRHHGRIEFIINT